MKTCNTCKERKELSEFHKRGGKRKSLQANCKSCDIEKTKAHRKRMRTLVGRWKMQKGCSHCNFKAVSQYQLDLDHIDPKTKTNKGNSRAIEPSWSLKRIKEELSKCQVLCKNCHALKTFTNNDHI